VICPNNSPLPQGARPASTIQASCVSAADRPPRAGRRQAAVARPAAPHLLSSQGLPGEDPPPFGKKNPPPNQHTGPAVTSRLDHKRWHNSGKRSCARTTWAGLEAGGWRGRGPANRRIQPPLNVAAGSAPGRRAGSRPRRQEPWQRAAVKRLTVHLPTGNAALSKARAWRWQLVKSHPPSCAAPGRWQQASGP